MTNAWRVSDNISSPLGRGREPRGGGKVRAMRNYHTLPSGSVDRAKGLRRNATDAEKRLWNVLREKLGGAKFRRQVPLGPYFVDFLSFSTKLIIEVDGGQHAERVEQDAVRTRYLESQGYRVLRVWNHDVMENMEGVLEAVSLSLREREGAAKRRKGEGDTPTSPSHSASPRGPLPLLRGEG
jgi:very-short-patch-repair endonuclease